MIFKICRLPPFRHVVCGLAVTFFSLQCHGVILISSNDPQRNTLAPSGYLAMSGFELQGQWGSYSGTPISPSYFITTKHVGGFVGQEFKLHGQSFTTIARFDDAFSELVIWKITGRFPVYASLYSSSDEVGKAVVVFGRGGPRSTPVILAGPTGSEPKGWYWNGSDGVLRWGENLVSAIVSDSEDGDLPEPGPQTRRGDMLKCEFDITGRPNEAHLSVGDSGGGLFIRTGQIWALAGIHYEVDGPYNTVPAGKGFGAALFDEGGFYKGGEGKWQFIEDLPTPQPGSFYATRISSRMTWIRSILGDDADGEDPPILEVGSTPGGAFALDPQAQINPSSRTFVAPVRTGQGFYRLKGAKTFRIQSIRCEAGNLMGSYTE